MSSLSPLGTMSCSTSVTNPYLYSVFASCSMTSVDVLICPCPARCQGPRFKVDGLYAEKLSPQPHVLFACGFFNVKLVASRLLLVEVEHRAVEQLEAARVDEDLRAARAFEDLVGRARRRVPAEHVAEARAAAGLDGDAQPAARKPFFASCRVMTRAALSEISIMFAFPILNRVPRGLDRERRHSGPLDRQLQLRDHRQRLHRPHVVESRALQAVRSPGSRWQSPRCSRTP